VEESTHWLHLTTHGKHCISKLNVNRLHKTAQNSYVTMGLSTLKFMFVLTE